MVEEFLRTMEMFREKNVKRFLDLCVDQVVRLIHANRGIDKRIIYSLKLIQEMGGISEEEVCDIYRNIEFEDIEDALVKALAIVGDEKIKLSEWSGRELELAYFIFLDRYSNLAREYRPCDSKSKQSIPLVHEEFCVNQSIKKALVQSVFYCAEDKSSNTSNTCIYSVELLGGNLVKRFKELASKISSIFNIKLDIRSINRFILEKIVEPVINEKGYRGINRGYEYLTNLTNIYDYLSKQDNIGIRDLKNVITKHRNNIGGDIRRLLQVIELYTNLYRKIKIDEKYVDTMIHGDIVIDEENELTIEILNKLPLPITINKITLYLTEIGYRLPLSKEQENIVINPESRELIKVRIPQLSPEYRKPLELRRELDSSIELKYSLPQIPLQTYVKNIRIPVSRHGWENRLKMILGEIIRNLVGEKIDITVDISKIHDIVLNSGGNNIVILGRHRDNYDVVIKIPVFYEEIKKTLAGDTLKKLEEIGNKCVDVTNKCSQKYSSIVNVIKISTRYPCAVEKYVPGRSLRDLIRERINVYQAINIAIRISEGLMCLHEQGVYHNDIRPENVIVELREGIVENVFLIDSCIDKVWNALRAEVGIPGRDLDERYVHPQLLEELKRGSMRDVYKKIDVFQLGVLLYETIFGENPVPMLKDRSEFVKNNLRGLHPKLGELLRKTLFLEELELEKIVDNLKEIYGKI